MFKFAIFTAQIAAIAGVATIGARAEPLEITITSVAMEETVELDAAEHYCMTEAVYFEGGNQSLDGKFAIANVVMNRVASSNFPDTICGVVHQGPLDGSAISLHRCQFSYYCDGKSDKMPKLNNTLEEAAVEWSSIIAEIVMHGEVEDNTYGSTYYHAYYADPFWNDVYEQVAVVDAHLFYVHSPR